MRARVFQINISHGGVPKKPVRAAAIKHRGVEGDSQSDTKNHGGVDRAVCLYSLERILALQDEGHPAYPGALGENITVAGLDWDEVKPGVKLRLGADALLEIVSYTAPCAKIKASFVGGLIGRLAQENHPGWARVYARVLKTGMVTTGASVEIVREEGARVPG